MDHLARRQRQIAARRERRDIDHAQPALFGVVQQVANAVRDTRTAGLDRSTQRRRIGDQQQRRTHCIDELAEMEVEALPFRPVRSALAPGCSSQSEASRYSSLRVR